MAGLAELKHRIRIPGMASTVRGAFDWDVAAYDALNPAPLPANIRLWATTFVA